MNVRFSTNSPDFDNFKLLANSSTNEKTDKLNEKVEQLDDQMKSCDQTSAYIAVALISTIAIGTIVALALSAYVSHGSGIGTGVGFGVIALGEGYFLFRTIRKHSTLQNEIGDEITVPYEKVTKVLKQYFKDRQDYFSKLEGEIKDKISSEEEINQQYEKYKRLDNKRYGMRNVDIEMLADDISRIAYRPENIPASNALNDCKLAAQRCKPIAWVSVSTDPTRKIHTAKELGIKMIMNGQKYTIEVDSAADTF